MALQPTNEILLHAFVSWTCLSPASTSFLSCRSGGRWIACSAAVTLQSGDVIDPPYSFHIDLNAGLLYISVKD